MMVSKLPKILEAIEGCSDFYLALTWAVLSSAVQSCIWIRCGGADSTSILSPNTAAVTQMLNRNFAELILTTTPTDR